MPMNTVAISLPEPVLDTVDRLAAEQGTSRSHVISTILPVEGHPGQTGPGHYRGGDVLFADARVAAERRRTASSG